MSTFKEQIQFTNVSTVAAGLDIGADTANVETNNVIAYKVANKTYIAAAESDIDLSAANLAEGGTLVIADGEVNIVTITVDTSGNYASYVGTAATSYAEVKPQKVDLKDEAVVGYVWIQNDTGSDFTIGTTALSTANVTDTYIDCAGLALFA